MDDPEDFLSTDFSAGPEEVIPFNSWCPEVAPAISPRSDDLATPVLNGAEQRAQQFGFSSPAFSTEFLNGLGEFDLSLPELLQVNQEVEVESFSSNFPLKESSPDFPLQESSSTLADQTAQLAGPATEDGPLSRRGRPRRTPYSESPSSTHSSSSRRPLPPKGSREYLERRERNNIAVRKSRQKARQEQQKNAALVENLRQQQNCLTNKVENLKDQLRELVRQYQEKKQKASKK